MIDKIPTVPLSPPTSPRMPDEVAKVNQHQWQHESRTSQERLEPVPLPLTAQQSIVARKKTQPPLLCTTEPLKLERPSLRSHKSFPYSLEGANRLQDDFTRLQPNTDPLGDFTRAQEDSATTASPDLRRTNVGASAPTSPVGRLTPHSPAGDNDGINMEDEDIELEAGEQEEGGADRPPMTAAELRAYKRKMKRFRLTHNQTRFLMSEFARQAHPDAAHRERLSREIPGLSPRQVQVWFQNRRAKLKRLTTDDRERMMRSRALPANFNMSQALQSPFGAPTPNVGAAATTMGNSARVENESGTRLLTLDTMRRHPQYEPYNHSYASSTGITPALGGIAFTPPQSATEVMSPVSNVSPFGFQVQQSPRGQSFGAAYGQAQGYSGHQQQMQRVHTYERFNRPIAETVRSPLRTSMSYSGLSSGGAAQIQPRDRTQSFSERQSYTHERIQPSRSSTNDSVTGPSPYGLGFTYQHPPTYQAMSQVQQYPPGPSSHQMMNPSQDQKPSQHLASSPVDYSNYSSSTFSTPQLPQYSHVGATSAYQYPYPQHMAGQPRQQVGVSPQLHAPFRQIFASNPNLNQQFASLAGAEHQEAELGDNSDGGVPLPPN